ncbi:MAG: hypothetical protein Q7V19_11675, partial [Bacteroidales bacterium]|nr:hypothetical protein [Bacteroidales bacterium]
MKTKKTPLLIACSVFFLFSFFCQAQTSEKLFDKPFFYESELTPEMIYVKWFSTGTKPAWDFLVLRFDEKKVVQVNGNKMSYLQNDTTFYVLQDTVPPVIRPGEMLQYFISPYDSNGKAGESSEIALISGDHAQKAWFTSTQATKTVNDFGVNVRWKLSNIAGVKFINIYRSVFSDKDYTLLSSVSATETSFTDRDTKADVVYFYQLEAVSLTGNKSIKSNVIFSAAFNPQPPVPPYIESVMPVKGGAILCIQITDEEVAGVRIYRDDGLVPTLILVSDLIPKSDASLIVFYDTLSA